MILDVLNDISNFIDNINGNILSPIIIININDESLILYK